MFKSIFSKYFAVVSLIVLFSFLVMGVVQTAISANFWLEEKQTLMTENVAQIAAVAAEDFRVSPTDASRYVLDVDKTRLPIVVGLLTGAIHADVMITDTHGVLLASAVSPDSQTIDYVPEDVIARVSTETTYFAVGTFGGLYDEPHYTACAPIVKDGACIGFVFAASPASGMTQYLVSQVQTYLISMLFVMLGAFAAIYLSTARLVRPLRHMSEAVRRFGEGDFSYRIPVKGRDEIATLGKALNNMAVSLSAAEDTSRSFVANVSHELKTPMTTIGGFIDGILDGTIPPEKQAYYLGIVSDEVKRMSRLVHAMLNLSRIDNGSLKLSPRAFDLTEVTCHTLLSFEPRIEEKDLRIEGLEDCGASEVSADPDLIGQVVYNLIDNAVKFTDRGGTVTFAIHPTPGRVEFRIRNTGHGIPVEEMPHIFERFYKSDKSRSLDKSGAGLGLFIVKSVINLHGGEIYVRSVENEYCEFFFWLPTGRAENVYEKSEKTSKKGHN